MVRAIMTYEEFDKRCDELENAPLQERKTFFADVLAGETEKTDVRMMAFFRYALLFYRAGDFLTAREILEPFIIDYKSYRYRPEIIACFNLVGVVAYYVQEYALSRFYIREGLKIAQEHSEVSRYAYEYNNLAVTYLAQQDYEKALEAIREAEKNMPASDEVMHAYVYRNLAEICCHLDRLDEAKDALAKCLAYRGREILPEEVRSVNTLLTYKSGDTAGYKRCCAELRDHLPQLHAEKFLASCKVLFDCGMDAGDNAQVEWVLDAMDAYLRRDPKEAQVGLRAETCRYEYAKANGNTALMLAALEKKETYYALVLARKEEVHVRDAGRYLRIGQRLQNALESEAGANRTKTRFLANMSHDIRTPINGILGMLEVIRDCRSDEARVDDCLGKIDISAKHLLSLVNDVLDMSKIESGNMQMLDTSFDLRALLDSCCSIVEGQVVDRHMTFTKQIGPFWHPYLIGSELHIRQVLINILSNAVKYTPDGGDINFRARETLFEEGLVHLRMEIKDNGIGMSEEFLQHIFEPFTQEQRSSRTHYKGTGLGMAITKKLVDQMHGSLDVESEPGKGSTFIVRLSLPLGTPPKAEPSVVVRHAASPAASGSSWDDASAAGAETAAAAPAAEKTVLPLAGLHLLLAEDNELNSEIATTLLEEQGASITAVENGRLALEAIQNAAPRTYDAILMDVMMPEMNGLEATRCIRAFEGNGPGEGTPIIAMTANVFADDVKACLDAGMNSHVGKPLDMKVLIGEILKYTDAR